ncbi:DUF805 domain-containing protein [Phenylobacterium terrae]|uniref:DUF805 domain-containing protein n=1 Tax=Phenylobacterium terrae TaxID=2665495 RepID=A0ABW4N519_9CAUL
MTDLRAQRPFNIFDLSGRASRLEFTIVLVAWLAVFIAYRGAGPQDLSMALLVGVAASVPMILTGVRRLHDRDQSGWWMLLSFVPLIGLIFLVFLAAGSPDERVNRFGPPARLLGAKG